MTSFAQVTSQVNGSQPEDQLTSRLHGAAPMIPWTERSIVMTFYYQQFRPQQQPSLFLYRQRDLLLHFWTISTAHCDIHALDLIRLRQVGNTVQRQKRHSRNVFLKDDQRPWYTWYHIYIYKTNICRNLPEIV